MNSVFLVHIFDMGQDRFVADSICKVFLPLFHDRTPILFVEWDVWNDFDYLSGHQAVRFTDIFQGLCHTDHRHNQSNPVDGGRSADSKKRYRRIGQQGSNSK
jgi:hypothetical protein